MGSMLEMLPLSIATWLLARTGFTDPDAQIRPG